MNAENNMERVVDVINAEKENELNIAPKTACNAIYGVHSFEHITKLEEKCNKLEEELNHYHELDEMIAELGFNDFEEFIESYKRVYGEIL